jgi:hypothetical protein
MTHIPKPLRSEVAVVWVSLAQKVANASLDDFTRLMIFPKSILSPVPSRENRGALSAGSIIRDRLRRWAEGEEMALFDDAAGRALSMVQPAGLPAFDETRLRRAIGLTRHGAFRKSSQALSSAPQAPKGETTVSILQALHLLPTQGPKPDRAHLQSPLPLTAEDCRIVKPPWKKSLLTPVSGAVTVIQHTRQLHLDGDRRVAP